MGTDWRAAGAGYQASDLGPTDRPLPRGDRVPRRAHLPADGDQGQRAARLRRLPGRTTSRGRSGDATGSAAEAGELSISFDGVEDPLVVQVKQATRSSTVIWDVESCAFLPDWAGTTPAFTLSRSSAGGGDRPLQAALDADGDPAEIGAWISEAKAQRLTAEAELCQASTRARLNRQQMTDLITEVGQVATALRAAEPGNAADAYKKLGLRLTYQPDRHVIRTAASPQQGNLGKWSVSEGERTQIPMCAGWCFRS